EDFWQYGDQVEKALANSGGSTECAAGWVRMVAAFGMSLALILDRAVAANETRVKEQYGVKDMSIRIGEIGGYFSVLSQVVQYGFPYSDGKLTFEAHPPIVAQSGSKVTYLDIACSGKYLPALLNKTASHQELFDTGLALISIINGPDYDWSNSDTREQVKQAKASKSGNLWGWQYCNEFGYLQDGNRRGSSMFSLTVSQDYNNWICKLYFGAAHSRPTIRLTNALYGGLDIVRTTSNIVFVNGASDPWGRLGVRQKQGWTNNYVFIENATNATSAYSHHCSDLSVPRATSPQAAWDTYNSIVAAWDSILKWNQTVVHRVPTRASIH
ncbi:hypothetical protein HDU91_003429, partial [Kappamyces sp. JEL0680]